MRAALTIAAGVTALVLSFAPRPIVVSGRVTDALTGQPIEGASVTVPGTPTGAQTDVDGRYRLRFSTDDSAAVVLEFRRIGYGLARHELATRSVADSIVIDIALRQLAYQLSALPSPATVDPVSGNKAPFTVSRLDGSGFVQLRAMGGGRGATAGPRSDPTRFNTEEYSHFEENPFRAVSQNPLSTLSADVDRAAYSNVRRFITQRQLPPKGAVRIEEMVNYFTYDYPAPDQAPIAIHTDAAPAPWKPAHQIVRIGLQARRVDASKLPPANLVFLIDVSGSMAPPNKLPLVKQAFRLLVDQLREQDRVAIVVYAGAAGVVLPSTPASEKIRILDAIERLEAGGSTAGGEGIRLAYQIARDHFRKEGNNRVILATDGDFNVGVSSTDALVDLVSDKRGEGIFLTALGFGMHNIKDHRLEQLADKGNGNYAYIDDIAEARKVFVSEFGATLFTVAKDVKIQVEFNPATVQAYRLIGYENRLLNKEDFTNDAKDAGEVGAGHTVTALYEIVPVGVRIDVDTGSTGPLRYTASAPTTQRHPDELMTVSVRYKEPDGERSKLIQASVTKRSKAASTDLRFASAVAAYGMLLRQSKHVGTFTWDAVAELAGDALGSDREHYRAEFVEMVKQTKAIASQMAGREK